MIIHGIVRVDGREGKSWRGKDGLILYILGLREAANVSVGELEPARTEKIVLNKMKVHIILLYCLCRSLAITVNYKTTGSVDIKENKESLKDIRLVSVNKSQPFPKPVLVKEQSKYLKQLRAVVEPKIIQQSLRKLDEKKKVTVESQARVDNSQTGNSNNQAQVQKIANQLYLAQKRASLLSDYQKFILSQDANVKNFVLGQSVQSRSPTPFLLKRPSGRSLRTQPKAKYVTSELPTVETRDLGKIVVVTPKAQAAVGKISKPKNDHKAQETHIKYVTLAPQSLAHIAEIQEPSQRVTILPYHTPQKYAYYNLGVTSKPQVKTVQIPTTEYVGLGSFELPQTRYYHQEDGQEESINYGDSKYEFMYKVKDHENNSNFGHQESRSDKTTYGYYFVQLPDGRLETVKYWADKTGYHAKVDYQGQAKHPTHTDQNVNFHNLVYH